MSKVILVTDSTSGMPAELARQYNVVIGAQTLIWGKETFLDSVTIQPDEFYQRLENASVMPSSSQLSPAEFETIFRDLLDQGYDVLAVLISTKLSGTINSAVQAKAAIQSDRIEIVDSMTTSMALGFAVMAAARLAAQGASLAACKAAAEEACQRSGVLISVETLEFLHRGGRIGGASRLIGTALNIKPILELQDGRIEPLEKVRTRAKALARMVDLLGERTGGKPFQIAVVHANAEKEAQELMKQVTSRFHTTQQVIAPVSPVVGTHVGPGTLGLVWMID
ncbi:MAG: DegV family protein [Anaerolineales bacterium]|jgi:DegV family protein with EDD domain|nr:DegV family protein [Anaerolineales bacterium]